MSGNRARTVADKTTNVDNAADACSEVSSCKNQTKSLLELSHADNFKYRITLQMLLQ